MSEHTAYEFAEQVAALLERQRTTMARGVLRDALKAFPDDTRLLLQAAWVDYMEDKMEAARTTAESILAREPDNNAAKQLMLELHIEAQHLADAEAIAIELLREMPENAHLYGRYAHIMLQALKLDKATALANEGLRYEPEDRECLAVRTMCDFVQHGSGETSPALQKLIVEHPQSLRALYLVVIALEQRGKNRQAHQLAIEMLRAQPSNQSLVELVQHFQSRTHWTMLPLLPLQKYGWGASIGLWLGGFIAVRVVGRYSVTAATVLSLIILAYVVYSWVWPPLFRKFFVNK